MMRWPRIPFRGALTLVAVLCLAAAMPLAAQQVSSPAPQHPGVSAAQARSTTTAQPGPRLQSEWRSVEPSLTDGRASTPATAASGTHTITVTTLVLVLAVIILVLLIAH